MNCKKCDEAHDGSFGSGVFCSKSCANSRTFTVDSRNKTSESVRSHRAENKRKVVFHKYICEKCHNEFEHKNRIKKGKRHHCENCKRKTTYVADPDSILSLSKRTVQKLLRRARIPCAWCGQASWKLEIHHICPRAMRGKEVWISSGGDGHRNLMAVCGNCHGLLDDISKFYGQKPYMDFLGMLHEKYSLESRFSHWKDFYKCGFATSGDDVGYKINIGNMLLEFSPESVSVPGKRKRFDAIKKLLESRQQPLIPATKKDCIDFLSGLDYGVNYRVEHGTITKKVVFVACGETNQELVERFQKELETLSAKLMENGV